MSEMYMYQASVRREMICQFTLHTYDFYINKLRLDIFN